MRKRGHVVFVGLFLGNRISGTIALMEGQHPQPLKKALEKFCESRKDLGTPVTLLRGEVVAINPLKKTRPEILLA